MPLSLGTRLGPYELVSALGAGGMGEVYKARDTRLDRTVAIKVLLASAALRPEARQRFEREARAVSSLNHPHICHLHDIGQHDGIDYLVMEHIEGETLDARLTHGPLPVEQALQYAIQIADALSQAHRQGVVHRDLKPGNVMLTKTGAKLLDFGLAKMAEPAPNGSGASEATHVMANTLTTAGTVLGTFQYMAPEQLEGKEADARTDIFAFGAVLYEMLTGRKAFPGTSQASLIAAVMSAEPARVSTLQPMTPPALDRVIGKCLAKQPDDRWQSASDLMSELKWIGESGSQPGVPPPVIARRKSRERIAWVLAAIGGIAALALAVALFRQKPPETFPVVFEQTLPPNMRLPNVAEPPKVSPDGRRVVVSLSPTGSRLWVRRIDSAQLTPLAGTDGALSPFWSPDSKFVAFFSGGSLKRVGIDGGSSQVLASIPEGAQGAWGADGIILIARGNLPIVQVSASGGTPKALLEMDRSRQETFQVLPSFLPDGRHFLYLSGSADSTKRGIYAASLDSKETHMVVDALSEVAFSPPNWLLFGRGASLYGQSFDLGKLRLTGEPFVITNESMVSQNALSRFSSSWNGVLAYRQGRNTERRFRWYDRSGKPLSAVGDPQPDIQFALSPDERQVVVHARAQQGTDLWTTDLATGIRSRVTSLSTIDTGVWSPDGREVFFSALKDGRQALYRKVAGGGEQQLVLSTTEHLYPAQWLKDGSLLFLNNQGTSFYRLKPGSDRPETLLKTEFAKDGLRVSPDGKWAAYNTLESGRWEVYIASFPDFNQRRQVSNKGGVQAQWRRDGKELYYLTLDGEMMSVPLSTGSGLQAGTPQSSFRTRIAIGATSDQYAVTSDGRFLTLEQEETGQDSFTIVVNWPALAGKN